MSMSDSFELSLLNHVFRNQAFQSLGSSLFIGLYTSAPGESGGGTEVSGGGYERASVSRATGTFTNTNPMTNTGLITFPESTGAWGTVTHFAILTAATGGTMLYHGALGSPQTVSNAGVTIQIRAGDLSISQD